MAPSALALIGATIVFSSFLSGVFGMAGGMILLGVLLNYFDVARAMILFSIIQLFANGWRVVQWRSYVLWPIFGWYVLGAAISFAGMWMIAFVPDKATVYLALGLMPFAVEALPAALRPNIEWKGVPLLTGVATTIIQILAGVGGLFLDLFFQKSKLDRKTTNATKAVAQSFSHVVRALYFILAGGTVYHHIGITLTGTFRCTRAALRHMMPRGSGAIVNNASVGAITGNPGISSYIASKHGVVGLTKNAAAEYGPRGLRINCVGPGYIETPLLAGVLLLISGATPAIELRVDALRLRANL